MKFGVEGVLKERARVVRMRRKSVDLAWLILNYRVRWIITRGAKVRYDDARIFINSMSNVKRGNAVR